MAGPFFITRYKINTDGQDQLTIVASPMAAVVVDLSKQTFE
jgi:hypothetical protein